MLTDVQLATILFGAPFIILSASWLVGLSLLALPARVVAKKGRV